ncbi:MAG: thiamine-phosphate kinase [Breznakibacter sp.]
MEQSKTTGLSSLGEFGLIEHIAENVSLKHKQTIKGIGDDAAVIDTSGQQTVVTTDLLLEGIHFDLTYTPLKHLGYKAVVVNLSDVYAMNAEPRQITVSLGLSSKMSLEAVEELYAGILLACETYHVDLVGGDTSTSLTGLTICITAIGAVSPNKVVYRSTAKPNDLICVSGDLGGAFMGLQLLEREKKVFGNTSAMQPDLAGYDYILERFLKPEARKDIISFLSKIGVVPTSMIDISDGLSSEILHICRQSDTGCRLYEEKVPVDHVTAMMAEELHIDPITAALNGGEDYELLFTISLADYEKFQGHPDVKIYAIGHVTEKSKGCAMITKSGAEATLKAQGWANFGK